MVDRLTCQFCSQIPRWGSISRPRSRSASKFPTICSHHDLRRTCVSGMARLGVAPHVAENPESSGRHDLRGCGRISTTRVPLGTKGRTREMGYSRCPHGGWWDKDHPKVCNRAFDAAIFISCVGVCSLVGASAIAVAVSGALVGGKNVIEALKAISKGTR
jgi:hypothetical protein